MDRRQLQIMNLHLPHTDIAHNWHLQNRWPRLHAFYLLGRFDRPTGWLLLYIPCLWGLALADGPIVPTILWAILFMVGAIVMRAAGCAINDIWDRRLDQQVTRTATRPLAAGTLNLFQASGFIIACLGIGLVIFLSLSDHAQIIALLVLPLVIIYPAMKRITSWPQMVLGLAFNWGVLVAFANTAHPMNINVFILYLSGVLWTLAYDTIYALQDVIDDAQIGIKSTARLFGAHVKYAIALFFSLSLLCLGIVLAQHWSFFALPLLALPTCHAIWQLRRLHPNNPRNCLYLFKSNIIYGLLVLLTLCLAQYAL